MSRSLPIGYEDDLIWWPEKKMGYHPRAPIDYDGDYWEKYLVYDATELGEKLTQARCNLVKKHTDKYGLVDIGIGGGKFVRDMDCLGFDVNLKAIAWLNEQGKFQDPYVKRVKAITCWDAIEHIPDPGALLRNVDEWVFASIPVFESGDKVTSSKHYRPGEHIWYFTHEGFIHFMHRHGFQIMDLNDDETRLGRESIMTYAFRRYK